MSGSGTNTLKDLTKSVLEDLYLKQLLTETQIAERFQTTGTSIRRRRIKWGIPSLGKTGRLTQSLPDLTEEQKEILIGSLLGDGSMSAPSPKTARFTEGHSFKQREYTDWKADQLGDFVSKRFKTTSKKEAIKGYEMWCFSTKATTHLREFYDLFYGSGVRVFPANLAELMTPRVLAIWYLDDGSIANQFHPRITFGLDDSSRKRAFKALRALGLRPTLHEQGSAISIEFPGQADQFFNLIGPYIPDCMAYKRPPPSERREQDKNAKKLTSEKARELYDGGMSLTEIANIYKVGRSTVHRRVHQEGPPKRMGRSRNNFSLRAAEEVLGNYDIKQYRDLSDEDKERWIEEVFEVLRKTPFPATPEWDQQAVAQDLLKLKDLQVGLEGDVIKSLSWRGTVCCQSFFPHRYKSSWRGSTSAYQAWHEDDALRSAIKHQFEYGDPVKPHRVLRAVTMKCRTPGVFRPAIAKFMYETYCPPGGKVWDPCAGWGGRLMGAAAAGVQYLGTDVEPDTVAGNLRLAEALGYSAQVILHPAETFELPHQVDMVFTSPPYFDVERYGGSEDQSYKNHTDFDSWCEGFLKPVIATAHKSLVPGGVLALNVADIKVRKKVLPLVDRTREIARAQGFVEEPTIYMPISSLNRTPEQAREPVLIFRRK